MRREEEFKNVSIQRFIDKLKRLMFLNTWWQNCGWMWGLWCW